MTKLQIAEVEAEIKNLELLVSTFEPCDYGSYEHRRQHAIERKLEDLDYTLRHAEGVYYDLQSEVY